MCTPSKAMFKEGDIMKRTVECISADKSHKLTYDEYGIHIGDGKIVFKEKYRDRGRILCVRKSVFQRTAPDVQVVDMDHKYGVCGAPALGTKTVERAIEAMKKDHVIFDATENDSEAFAVWCRFGKGPAQFKN